MHVSSALCPAFSAGESVELQAEEGMFSRPVMERGMGPGSGLTRKVSKDHKRHILRLYYLLGGVHLYNKYLLSSSTRQQRRQASHFPQEVYSLKYE